MKLKNNIDVAKLAESFYFDNCTEYKKLFETVSAAESGNAVKLNLPEFQHIASEYVELYDKIMSGEIIECLYLIYNWYKYRLIYSITNPDKTISHFNDKVSSDIVESKFFDTFFIEYDFVNLAYVGAFIDISKTQITLGFIKKEDTFWHIEPVVLDIDLTSETDIYQAYSHYLSNTEYYSDNWTDPLSKALFPSIIASKPEPINAAGQTLRIIRAMVQGYQNLSDNANHYHTDLTPQTEHSKTNVVKCSVKKKQLIVVGTKSIDIIDDYEFYPTCLAGTPKSPHPRREHTRKIKDSTSATGYREIKVRSTIVHKDQYKDTTEKIVK